MLAIAIQSCHCEGVEASNSSGLISAEVTQLPALERGDMVAVAIAPEVGLVLVAESGWTCRFECGCEPEGLALIQQLDRHIRPRWVLWSGSTARLLVQCQCRLATCWDLSAVYRLLVGGWRSDPGLIWAQAHGLRSDDIPVAIAEDLFTTVVDVTQSEQPVDAAGYLRAEWASGGWADSIDRLQRWALLSLQVARLQGAHLAALTDRPLASSTARSESTAELMCAELEADGLPMSRIQAESVIASFVGQRPANDNDAAMMRDQRDRLVLDHLPANASFDLRSPGSVRSLLRRVGIEVPDTRAWRLEALAEANPVVAALLEWRKSERFATTFGYRWLDEFLGVDGRLRGSWSGCDGAAGRMTATAGLHNMPAVLRSAVQAEPGFSFVRADLGQIEPRVLAVVSGDAQFALAATEDDLYLPVAKQLGVERSEAKLAVLGAMYGQTTGLGARALRGLELAYPTAMTYLAAADRAGQVSAELRTVGGRLIRMGATNTNEVDDRDARSSAAARGRYGRNAMIQGAAAELFKMWAATVRARCLQADTGAQIVLCLHDELLVHAPTHQADSVAAIVESSLQEASSRWSSASSVRFVADVRIIDNWAMAKD